MGTSASFFSTDIAEQRSGLIHFTPLVTGLLLFGLGVGVSIYQGVSRVLSPQPIENATISYVVLSLSIVFEGSSWVVAWRAVSRAKGEQGFWTAFRRSKDPPTFMVLFEDSAALIGILIAMAGIFCATRLGMPIIDGIASVLIGCVLGVTAVLLAIESKNLLIGERAAPALVESSCDLAGKEPGVVRANSALTAQLSPNQAVVALSIEFERDLRTVQIETCVASIERSIRSAHPGVVALS